MYNYDTSGDVRETLPEAQTEQKITNKERLEHLSHNLKQADYYEQTMIRWRYAANATATDRIKAEIKQCVQALKQLETRCSCIKCTSAIISCSKSNSCICCNIGKWSGQWYWCGCRSGVGNNTTTSPSVKSENIIYNKLKATIVKIRKIYNGAIPPDDTFNRIYEAIVEVHGIYKRYKTILTTIKTTNTDIKPANKHMKPQWEEFIKTKQNVILDKG